MPLVYKLLKIRFYVELQFCYDRVLKKQLYWRIVENNNVLPIWPGRHRVMHSCHHSKDGKIPILNRVYYMLHYFAFFFFVFENEKLFCCHPILVLNTRTSAHRFL